MGPNGIWIGIARVITHQTDMEMQPLSNHSPVIRREGEYAERINLYLPVTIIPHFKPHGERSQKLPIIRIICGDGCPTKDSGDHRKNIEKFVTPETGVATLGRVFVGFDHRAVIAGGVAQRSESHDLPGI